MQEQEQRGRFYLGVMVGGILGALAGILIAPKSGKELRADITQKGREILKDTKDLYTEVSAKTKETLGEAKHHAVALKNDADRHLSEARQKTKEIWTRCEKDEEGVQ